MFWFGLYGKAQKISWDTAGFVLAILVVLASDARLYRPHWPLRSVAYNARVLDDVLWVVDIHKLNGAVNGGFFIEL